MVAKLSATPDPVPVGSVTAITGSGFNNRLTRLKLDGAIVADSFRASKGTFVLGVLVSKSVTSHTLTAEQKQPGGSWSVVVRLAPLLTFSPAVLDTTAPVQSAVQAINITETSFIVSWVTNEPSTTVVNYGTTGSYGSTVTQGSLVTSHSILVSGLTASTLYYYRARSTDAAGNEVIGSQQTVTTFNPAQTDTTAPVISNIVATPSADGTSCVISWDLDEFGTGQVQFGLTTAYGSFSVKETSFAYDGHVQTIVGLTPNQTYNYRILSDDASGNHGVSGNLTFSTSTASASYPTPVALSYVATNADAMPGYLSEITDSTWGTKIRRISNIDGTKNLYSRHQSWSKNGTHIYLAGGSHLLNASTYADLGSISTDSDMPVWSNTNNDYMFGVRVTTNTMKRYSVAGNNTTTVATFTGYARASIGNYEGNLSDNDRVALIVNTAADGSGTWSVIVWDIPNAVKLSTLVIGTGNEPNNCCMSRSGDYVVIEHGQTGTGTFQGTRLYNAADMSHIRQIVTTRPHADAARNAAGQDIFVHEEGPGGATVHVMATGASYDLLPGSTQLDAGHISGCCYERPGYVVMTSNTSSTLPGNDQIVAVRTDGSGIVEPFGFTHSPGDGAYDQSPHGSCNRDGTKVIFTSDWNGASTYGFVAGVTT